MNEEERKTITVGELIAKLERIENKELKVFIPGYSGHARVVRGVNTMGFIFKNNGEPLRVEDRYVGDRKDTYIEMGVEIS